MTDASDQAAPPTAHPAKVPEFYVMPRPLLEKWLAIPANKYVRTRLTRYDIDRLFFAFTKGFDAQQALQQCVIEWSNGRVDAANAYMAEAQRLSAEGNNEFRQLFTALMAAAEIDE